MPEIKTDPKQKAQEYVTGKPILNPYEVYEGYIAGWDEVLKTQSKAVLQSMLSLKEEYETQAESNSKIVNSLREQIARLREELRKATGNNGNGNGNNGHAHSPENGNSGNNGNNGNNGNGNNGNGNNGNNGNGNGHAHGNGE